MREGRRVGPFRCGWKRCHTRRHASRTSLKAATLAPLAAPAIAQPGKAATLRFIPQSNLAALDPVWTTATVTNNHGYYVYDTLYAAGADMRPRPQMAEGHDVRRRPDLAHPPAPRPAVPRQHAGAARDRIASLQRWCQRDAMGQIMAAVVAQWSAPDDRTLELRLTRPFPLLLDALAKPDASCPFIMPERIARTDAMVAFTEVVGSGPYRFLPDEYVSGARVAYARHEATSPGPKPRNGRAGRRSPISRGSSGT